MAKISCYRERLIDIITRNAIREIQEAEDREFLRCLELNINYMSSDIFDDDCFIISKANRLRDDLCKK